MLAGLVVRDVRPPVRDVFPIKYIVYGLNNINCEDANIMVITLAKYNL